MKLNEAIATGKKFARKADAEMGDYLSAEEYLGGGLGIEDYNATDFEVEPDVAGTLTVKMLATAWDAAKGSSSSIGKSDSSPFFSRLVAHLSKTGVITN